MPRVSSTGGSGRRETTDLLYLTRYVLNPVRDCILLTSPQLSRTNVWGNETHTCLGGANQSSLQPSGMRPIGKTRYSGPFGAEGVLGSIICCYIVRVLYISGRYTYLGALGYSLSFSNQGAEHPNNFRALDGCVAHNSAALVLSNIHSLRMQLFRVGLPPALVKLRRCQRALSSFISFLC